MKKVVLAFIAGALAVTPAKAVLLNVGDVGAFGTTNIQGQIEGQVVNGLTGTLYLAYTGVSNGGLTWNFVYGVDNTSTGLVTDSRISSFGINTTPDMTAVSSTGLYQYSQLTPGGIPGFIGQTDFCAGSSAGSCTGGLGVLPGDAIAFGTFSLTYASTLSLLSLDSAFFRFQSIVGSPLGTSGAGLNVGDLNITPLDVSPVPIPAVGTGLPGIVGGVAGLIYWLKKRRRQRYEAGA